MTTLDATLLAERLTEIVGASQIVADPEAIDGVPPRFSVAPASLDAAGSVLRVARDAGASVAPWGGGTQQRIGYPPARVDILLRTERLHGILEWEPADLTASVQAGLTLQALQERLAEHGQQLPLDAPLPSAATLGGLVATNTSGPRRWQFGSWRDLIVGMHVALCDGTVIKTGGRVVKNVQGYDLGKLFTGSLGTLCLIGQINVKLVPLPPLRRLLVGRGALEQVCRFVQDVAASTARVAAIDVLDSTAAKLCGLGAGGCAGLVLIEDRRDIVDAQSLAVERMAREAGASPDRIDDDALEPVWREWVDLGRTDDLGANEALVGVGALPNEVGSVVESIQRLQQQHQLEGPVWARAGNGLVYARLSTRQANSPALHASVQALLLQRWPQTTLTAGSPDVAHAAKPWGAGPTSLPVMRALKQRFDPTRTLQPGRYVGGI